MSINISHLVVIGCSFSYGQGLDNPKEDAWPAILANKLSVPVVNLSTPGGGNDRIMRKLFEYYHADNKGNNPFYIVPFSHSSRREEYILEENDYRVIDMHPLSYRKNQYGYTRPALMHYNQEAASARKLMIQTYIIDFFRANNTNYLTSDFLPDSVTDHHTLKLSFPTAYDKVYNDPYKLIDLANFSKQHTPLPCGHDGPEAQHAIANYIHDELTARYGQPTPVNDTFVSLKEFRDLYPKAGSYPGEKTWL